MGIASASTRKEKTLKIIMGGNNVKFDKEDEEAYKHLTYLTERGVKQCYKRFSGLLQDRPEVNENPSDVIRNSRVLIDKIIGIEELKVNPFAKHLCSVFAQQNRNDPSATMMFEDFLDMMSVLSENAPAQVKAEWAFKIFDDSKDYEDDKDAKRPEIDLQKVVRNVISETDMNKSDHINLVEFKQIVSKSHDFTDNFRIKL